MNDTAPTKSARGKTQMTPTKIAGRKSKSAGGKTTKTKKEVVQQRCRGKNVGFFRKQDYYFRQHGQAYHECKLQHGGRQYNLDSRPSLLVISAAPSWGITDTVLMQMKDALKSCTEAWWTPLPQQDHTRH